MCASGLTASKSSTANEHRQLKGRMMVRPAQFTCGLTRRADSVITGALLPHVHLSTYDFARQVTISV
jgi:hypothetical protein